MARRAWRFVIPQNTVQKINIKMRAKEQVAFDVFSRDQGKVGSGYIEYLADTIDSATGTLLCKGVVAENKDNRNPLYPGSYVDIQLHLDTKQNVTLLPLESIRTGEDGKRFVRVIQPDQMVAVRPVTTGTMERSDAHDPAMCEITSGISPGEIAVLYDEVKEAGAPG